MDNQAKVSLQRISRQVDMQYNHVAVSNMAPRYDVVVVGAGPAGIMAAVESARAAHRVLLVEADKLPRYKSCGGMLNKYSRQTLAAYGDIPKEIILNPPWIDFRYYHLDRRVKKATKVRFLNVDRGLFDTWLLSLLPANVDVAACTRLCDVVQTPAEVCVLLRDTQHISKDGSGVAYSDNAVRTKQVTCGHLIAADGPRATVRERLGLRPFKRYITVQEYVKIQPGALEPYFDCIYSQKFSKDYGIGYIMPKGEVAVIGSIFYPGSKNCGSKHEAVLEVLRGIYPIGGSVKRETWMAARLTCPEDLVAGQGRVLLAGEGGGFLSCTSGEGISFALNSGVYAGCAVAGSLALHSHRADSALEHYNQALGPMKRNLAFRMRMFPFMNNDICKNLACLVPTPIVSKMTERL